MVCFFCSTGHTIYSNIPEKAGKFQKKPVDKEDRLDYQVAFLDSFDKLFYSLYLLVI